MFKKRFIIECNGIWDTENDNKQLTWRELCDTLNELYIENKNLKDTNKFNVAESLFSILQNNYGKYDSEINMINGEKHFVDKNEIVILNGTCLCWEDEVDGCSTVFETVNLDLASGIRTIIE